MVKIPLSTQTEDEGLGRVEANAWKIDALRQAKEEAMKGEFISHQAMSEWIASLGSESELSEPGIDVFKNSL